MWGPKKISTIFLPFLAIFTLFHLKNQLYLQKPDFRNLPETRFWFLLVNNSLCSIPPSGAKSYIKETPGDSCVITCHRQSRQEERHWLWWWSRKYQQSIFRIFMDLLHPLLTEFYIHYFWHIKAPLLDRLTNFVWLFSDAKCMQTVFCSISSQ